MSQFKPLALPPEFEAERFDEFILKAQDVVGADNVSVVTGPESLNKRDYMDPSKVHDMFPLFDPEYFVSSAVVSPRHVGEVQSMMRLCNEFKMPVWPFSIGRNVGYGGAGPRVPGSIGLDMGRHMNKVLNVNEQNAFALVEPGVTYSGLYDYLVSKGLEDKLWLDCPDLGGGSVLGNTSERGVGYTPYGDHFMMHCGMEVVLPDGSLIRTGMGAMPNPNADQSAPLHEQEGNRCWQLFNYGFGPYHDGVFSQSNYGVITKLGIWLMPNPGGYQPYLVTFQKESDLAQIVEATRFLRVNMVIQNVPTVRHLLLDAACQGSKISFYPDAADRPLTEPEMQALQTKLNLGRWNFYGAMYGPEPVRAAFWSVIQASFGKIPGARFHFQEEGKKAPGVLDTRAQTMAGRPTYDELQWVDWVPNGAHLFFSPISEVTAEAATTQFGLTKKRVLEAGFDYIPNFCVGMREMHHIVCLVYDRTSKEQRVRMHTLIRTLIEDCAAHGWGEYRTHLALMDQIADTYGWNEGALMKLSDRFKDAVDPKGILAPGKNGVWGGAWEKERWRLDGKSEMKKKRP